MPQLIRCAAVGDINNVARFLLESKDSFGHLNDIAGDFDITVRSLTHYAISPRCFFYVIEADGCIAGVFIGAIAPMLWSKGDVASDIVFHVKPGNTGGMALVRRFIKWATDFDSVPRIMLGLSTGDERVGKIYEYLGFKITPTRIYIKEINR